MGSPATFRAELEQLINRSSMENGSNTPDFVLAKFLSGCLEAFDYAIHEREVFYDRDPQLGPVSIDDPADSIETEPGVFVRTVPADVTCGRECSKESCRSPCVLAPGHEGEYHSCLY